MSPTCSVAVYAQFLSHWSSIHGQTLSFLVYSVNNFGQCLYTPHLIHSLTNRSSNYQDSPWDNVFRNVWERPLWFLTDPMTRYQDLFWKTKTTAKKFFFSSPYNKLFCSSLIIYFLTFGKRLIFDIQKNGLSPCVNKERTWWIIQTNAWLMSFALPVL